MVVCSRWAFSWCYCSCALLSELISPTTRGDLNFYFKTAAWSCVFLHTYQAITRRQLFSEVQQGPQGLTCSSRPFMSDDALNQALSGAAVGSTGLRDPGGQAWEARTEVWLSLSGQWITRSKQPCQTLFWVPGVPSSVWLCSPMGCIPPGSSTRRISQARILDWACHFLLQGIFRTQGSNPCLLHLLHWQTDSLPVVPPESKAPDDVHSLSHNHGKKLSLDRSVTTRLLYSRRAVCSYWVTNPRMLLEGNVYSSFNCVCVCTHRFVCMPSTESRHCNRFYNPVRRGRETSHR